MGKHFTNAAMTYRFIAGLGIVGLVAAHAIAQNAAGQFVHSAFRGANSLPLTHFISSTQMTPLTNIASETGARGFLSPAVSAQPITSGFTNPFSGETLQGALDQNISIFANGQNAVGSSATGGTGVSGANAGTLSAGIVTGAGSAFGGSGTGTIALPSFSSLPSGSSGATTGASGVKGSFCGGYGG